MAKLGEYYGQLRNMTKQQVVEAGVTHLVKQGRRSLEGDFCAFRGKKGSCCGAAPFIFPNYPEEMNAEGYLNLIDQGYAHEVHSNIISRLQKLHDDCPPKRWKNCAPSVIGHEYDWSFLEKL